MNQTKALVRTIKRLQQELRDAPDGSSRHDYCQQRIARALISLLVEVENCEPPRWCAVPLLVDRVFGPFETKEAAALFAASEEGFSAVEMEEA